MAANRSRRRARRRYGWALLVPRRRERSLSGRARTGLWYAEQFARNAQERRGAAALQNRAPERLTDKQLAEQEDVSRSEIQTDIKQARTELFGSNLSDSAAYYRLRQARQLASRPPRRCQQPGCTQLLPTEATVRRRFCDLHGSGGARVQRHRERNRSR